MARVSLEPVDRAAGGRASLATMTDLARYSVELDAIREAMAALALSRLADTSAWVRTSWMITEAEGALRRAASGWWMSPPAVEELAASLRSAWSALRELESLGQGPPRWAAAPDHRDGSRHRATAGLDERLGPDGHR
jgi:hypothetical protein